MENFLTMLDKYGLRQDLFDVSRVKPKQEPEAAIGQPLPLPAFLSPFPPPDLSVVGVRLPANSSSASTMEEEGGQDRGEDGPIGWPVGEGDEDFLL